jgi:hypothetical protein
LLEAAEVLEALEVGFGFFQLGKEALFGLELARMDAAATGFDSHRVLEVEHLVIKQIFDCTSRRISTIEDTANNDSVVGGVVVT